MANNVGMLVVRECCKNAAKASTSLSTDGHQRVCCERCEDGAKEKGEILTERMCYININK